MRRFLLPALFLAALAGCTPVKVQPGPQEDACPVCAYNRDLACVLVPVTPETPHAEHKGHTVHFCSDTCKEAFLKEPGKYDK